MKIIGKHKDYFDFVAHQYGIDERCILDRRGIGEFSTDVCNHSIGGYNGITVPITDRVVSNWTVSYDLGIRKETYHIDKFLVVNGRGYALVKGKIANEHNSEYKPLQAWRKRFDTMLIDNGEFKNVFVALSKACQRHAFVAGYKRSGWVIEGEYPNMGEMGIAAYIDPYQMYIETTAFINEHLTKQIEVETNMSNKEKIASHGFDLKSSFRGK
jgi:hypothetical protein